MELKKVAAEDASRIVEGSEFRKETTDTKMRIYEKLNESVEQRKTPSETALQATKTHVLTPKVFVTQKAGT